MLISLNQKLKLKNTYYPNLCSTWTPQSKFYSILFIIIVLRIDCNNIKSCYDSAHICPIRAEISTHGYWENVFILLFVWFVIMGYRQNFFYISHNFGDFGAKMSFFRYIINQKRKIFIKHCPPPPCSKTTLISEMCIYITNNLCKWGLGTRGGGQCSTD